MLLTHDEVLGEVAQSGVGVLFFEGWGSGPPERESARCELRENSFQFQTSAMDSSRHEENDSN